MKLLLNRTLLSWCLLKARAGKFVLALSALLVIVPTMFLRLTVTETIAKHLDQVHKLSRRFLIGEEGYFQAGSLDYLSTLKEHPILLELDKAQLSDKSKPEVDEPQNTNRFMSQRSPIRDSYGKENDSLALTELKKQASIDHQNSSESGDRFENETKFKALLWRKELNHDIVALVNKNGTLNIEKKKKSSDRNDTNPGDISYRSNSSSSYNDFESIKDETDFRSEAIRDTNGKGRDREGQQDSSRRGCKDVLGRAIVGKWVPRQYTSDELKAVQSFLNTTRDYMGFPPSLQRPDKKCGNVSFGEYTQGDKITYRWFRALCNPFGETPCCHQNRCVARPVERCKCRECMDLRQQKHAELSTWIPIDTGCKLIRYKPGEETCSALEGFTVHFLGDSLLRQVFVAFMRLLKVPEPELDVEEELFRCRGYYGYLPYCARFLPSSVKPCGRKHVIVKRTTVKRSFEAPEIIKQMSRYIGQRNSIVVIGMGMHDHLNVNLILETVVEPIVAETARFNSSWPRLVWVSPHAPGLLKSPWLPSQLAPGILNFNNHINTVFTNAGIPVLNTFGLTVDGVMTYDGLHYGHGVNTLKAHILINYIQEIRKRENGY
ncbi:hypothetical protein PoB_001640000 [Plakobranchus ocellatus]|uniref:Uncharacterized protein n=1 Tax=Plakobranchus ocellatus TaxID=259542 RepID=A0AAV3Z411_9GAST|nr:hypothetical protein PoB_001640000 [Plakobranchus ocellatus]